MEVGKIYIYTKNKHFIEFECKFIFPNGDAAGIFKKSGISTIIPVVSQSLYKEKRKLRKTSFNIVICINKRNPDYVYRYITDVSIREIKENSNKSVYEILDIIPFEWEEKL